MKLINEQAVHRVFGVGDVKAVDEGRITIQFKEGVGSKMFSYPGAFDEHLKMCSSLPQEFVSGELKKMQDEITEEYDRHIQEGLEEANRLVAEKAEAKLKKTKTTKATAKAAKTAKTAKSAKATKTEEVD